MKNKIRKSRKLDLIPSRISYNNYIKDKMIELEIRKDIRESKALEKAFESIMPGMNTFLSGFLNKGEKGMYDFLNTMDLIDSLVYNEDALLPLKRNRIKKIKKQSELKEHRLEFTKYQSLVNRVMDFLPPSVFYRKGRIIYIKIEFEGLIGDHKIDRRWFRKAMRKHGYKFDKRII